MATIAKKPAVKKKPAAKRVAIESTTNTQAQLDAHERECAVRYSSVLEKLQSLHNRMWRLEGYLIFGIAAIILSKYIHLL
jgi:hypothetical protein